MKITVIQIGKVKSAEAEALIGYYSGLCQNKGIDYNLEVVKESKLSGTASASAGKLVPSEVLAELGLAKANTFFLAEWGREYDSKGFQELINKKREMAEDITFVMGSAHGWQRGGAGGGDGIQFLSLSKLIFPHELAAVLLWEQLFRFSDKLRGGNYSK